MTATTRIALGCMRLSTELADDEPRALAVLAAALDAGVVLFDTAQAYAPHEADLGHNERLVGKALRAHPAKPAVRVVTKCGMRRDGGAWIPDGRAKSIASDVAASIQALGGVPIDVLLLHAPDPRVPLATSGRALARACEEGIVRAVGVSNVSRKQLEELAAHAPISAVEVAIGAYDDLAIRSGVIAYCEQRGIEVFAHAPLGGPDRAARLARDPKLSAVARQFEGASAIDVFLAYVLALRPALVPIVGARRPETVVRWKIAESIALSDADLATIDARFPRLGAPRRAGTTQISAVPKERDVEVVVLMGIPGAGKSRAAEPYVARGYERLNRDNAGGTLRAIAKALDERLAAGASRIVLDNTYVTRASRADVVRVASSYGARVRCVHLATPLFEAQVNVVFRMIQRFGRVVAPEEMSELARTDPAAIAPHALARMTRELEPPAGDEGFTEIEIVRFARDPEVGRRGATVMALDVLERTRKETLLTEVDRWRAPDSERGRGEPERGAQAPYLLYAWRPGASDASLAASEAIAADFRGAGRSVDVAICRHPEGHPVCWCRPPLPALLVAFAHRHGVDLRASTLIGRSQTDRRMASVLGMTFVEA
jgi:aryl-alcohol dehydrogenase-like predicted oxidoreductase